MDNSELERQLAKLAPASLTSEFSDELLCDCEGITGSRQKSGNGQVHWKRLIPLSIAAAVVMVSYFSFRFGDALSNHAVAEQTAFDNISVTDTIAPPSQQGFVPVSSAGYLLKTSSGGIKESKSGPVEELNFQYQDVYHWRDMETNTNIRFFTPRNERVMAPVITN